MSHSPNQLSPAQPGMEHIPSPEEFDAEAELAQRTHLLETGRDKITGEVIHATYDQYGRPVTGERSQEIRAAHAIADPNRWLLQPGDSVEARVDEKMQREHGHKRIQSIGMGMLRAAAEEEIAPVFERQAALDRHIRDKQAAEARRAQDIADRRKEQVDAAKLHAASDQAAQDTEARTLAAGEAEVAALKTPLERHYAGQELSDRARQAGRAARTARIEHIQANGGADAIEAIEQQEAADAKKEAFMRKIYGADYERRILQRPDGVSATLWLNASLDERRRLIAEAGQATPTPSPQPAPQPPRPTPPLPVPVPAPLPPARRQPTPTPVPHPPRRLPAGEYGEDRKQIFGYPPAGLVTQAREVFKQAGSDVATFLELTAKNNMYKQRESRLQGGAFQSLSEMEEAARPDPLRGLNKKEREQYTALKEKLNTVKKDGLDGEYGEILFHLHDWDGILAQASEGQTMLTKTDAHLARVMFDGGGRSTKLNTKNLIDELYNRANDPIMQRRENIPTTWFVAEDGSIGSGSGTFIRPGDVIMTLYGPDDDFVPKLVHNPEPTQAKPMALPRQRRVAGRSKKQPEATQPGAQGETSRRERLAQRIKLVRQLIPTGRRYDDKVESLEARMDALFPDATNKKSSNKS